MFHHGRVLIPNGIPFQIQSIFLDHMRSNVHKIFALIVMRWPRHFGGIKVGIATKEESNP